MNRKALWLTLAVLVPGFILVRTLKGGALETAVSASTAVGTGFTYQGYLEDGGSPANGVFDLEFKLYDAAVNGQAVGTAVVANDVQVVAGLFTAMLDFGNVFDGSALWLQIGVRAGSSSGAFTTLAPRQALTAVPYALALPGLRSEQNATSPNLIGGYAGNNIALGIAGASIGGGGTFGGVNQVGADYATISGGLGNTADGPSSVVSGGNHNRATEYFAVVGGGVINEARAVRAVVGGGGGNTAIGKSSTIAGGENNSAAGQYATVGGGRHNVVTGTYGTIAGGGHLAGFGNTVTDEGGAIGGGGNNHAGNNNSVLNDAYYSTVSGGWTNTASGEYVTVGGGSGNDASGDSATIGGGWGNSAAGSASTIGGGTNNIVDGIESTIGGGLNNSISGAHWATIGGGTYNAANGIIAAVGGGSGNIASGDAATIPGGESASAAHFGQLAYASGDFNAVGDAQTSLFVMRNTTTDATPTLLFLDGYNDLLTIAPDQTMSFDILIAATTSGGQVIAGYQIQGLVQNYLGTVMFVGTPAVTVLGEDNAAWDVTVMANGTSDSLDIQVTGEAGTVIRWVASVRTVEVTFP